MKRLPIFLGCGAVLAVSACKPVPVDEQVKQLEEKVDELSKSLEEKDSVIRTMQAEHEKERLLWNRDKTRLERDHSRALSMLERVGGTKLPAPPESAGAEVAGWDGMKDSVAVIEGDRSRGTAFLMNEEGKTYLYTAAHVIAGNTRLGVTTEAGTKLAKFGTLELAEGTDVVRLEVLEAGGAKGLERAEENSALADSQVMVLADSGSGVVPLRTRISSVMSDQVRLDPGLKDERDGGPVICGGKVVAVATALTDLRGDVWAEAKLGLGARRESCRLDRKLDWQVVPIGTFLTEAKRLEDFDRLTRAGWAMSVAEPGGKGLSAEMIQGVTAGRVLEESVDLPASKEVLELLKAAEGRGREDFEGGRRKFLDVMTKVAKNLEDGVEDLDPAKFSGYHRKRAEESLGWRQRLNEVLRDKLGG